MKLLNWKWLPHFLFALSSLLQVGFFLKFWSIYFALTVVTLLFILMLGLVLWAQRRYPDPTPLQVTHSG